MDAAWAETGDRYMLKLFRDYLFHSVTPDGRPWVDQAHLVFCLNQLDGGSVNKVIKFAIHWSLDWLLLTNNLNDIQIMQWLF